jgi:hypothetical protein
MADIPKSELPFEDPFESQAVQDPFVDDHFQQQNQATGGTWSEAVPDSTAVLVLGILSIIGAFCYGVVGLILGIIAVAIASKPERTYRQNPSRFTQTSYSNLRAGKICGIIGISLSGFVILMVLLIFVAAVGR